MNLPAKSNNLANNFRGAGYILETALADLIEIKPTEIQKDSHVSMILVGQIRQLHFKIRLV
ncbi:MAG TPA: hypothetical protein DCX06_05515 [Opitutae bacterium]|nr:hypothetical protein [Opitutae bacterium]